MTLALLVPFYHSQQHVQSKHERLRANRGGAASAHHQPIPVSHIHRPRCRRWCLRVPEISGLYRPTNTSTKPPSLPREIFSEAKSLIHLCFPIGIAGLLLYANSVVSMLFLGSLGELELATGSLTIAFANITGYSIISALVLGMELLCLQAYGARWPKVLSLTLHRGILFLLSSSLPILLLWTHVSAILVFMRQDPEIAGLAQKYLLFCLPDLGTFSFIHPIPIYL